MDDVTAIHTAARQYCIVRAASWHERDAELTSGGNATIDRSGGGWSYTVEAYDVFPRYQTLSAIQIEVERFVPSDFSSLEDVRGILELAGESAQSNFTRYKDPVAIAAAQDERQQFAAFIRTADAAFLATQRPLPFRHVLGSAEHNNLRIGLEQRWGKWYGGQVQQTSQAQDTITIHIEAMREPASYEQLRSALAERGISRVFELREHGDGFEMETASAGFTYDGAEGFWTSSDFGWLVYASHESSVTFGGTWLVETMRRSIPEFDKYIYKGWDLAAYF